MLAVFIDEVEDNLNNEAKKKILSSATFIYKTTVPSWPFMLPKLLITTSGCWVDPREGFSNPVGGRPQGPSPNHLLPIYYPKNTNSFALSTFCQVKSQVLADRVHVWVTPAIFGIDEQMQS